MQRGLRKLSSYSDHAPPPIFNPYATELISAPYAAYSELRAADPVYWSPSLRAWILTRFDDIRSVLEDESFEAVNPAVILAEVARKSGRDYTASIRFLDAMLFFDNGSHHKQNRRLMSKIINNVQFESVRLFTNEKVASLLSMASGSGRYDIVHALANPLPQYVMSLILGLPAQDVPILDTLTHDVTLLFDTVPIRVYDRINRDVVAALELLQSRLGSCENPECNSGLRMIYDHALGSGTSKREDAAATALFIFRVGAETTSGLIGSAIRTLINDRELYRRARGNRSLAPRIVSEVLRLELGVQRVGRVSREARVVGGRTISAGDRVVLLIGAGNRDAEIFPMPDQLELERRDAPDLAFGGGSHFCLGARLALMEASVAVECFLRLPLVESDGDEQWYSNHSIRRLTSLPVRTVVDPNE